MRLTSGFKTTVYVKQQTEKKQKYLEKNIYLFIYLRIKAEHHSLNPLAICGGPLVATSGIAIAANTTCLTCIWV